jgi:peptide/nickel transport system permease protein
VNGPFPSRSSGPRARNRDAAACTAAAFLVVLGLLALLAPLFVADPESGELGDALQGPSRDHWLGTDHLGRDEMARLVFGARISLIAGLEAASIAVLIGVPIGLVAGYRQGWFDRITMRFVEVAVAIPALVVAMAVVAVTGPGVTTSMLAVGLVSATIMARLTRTVVTSACEADYVDGARVTGASTSRIFLRHLAPNIAPPLIVQTTLIMAAAIVAEASLSFLSLGAVPPTPSWGVMLNQARDHLDDAPLLAVWPGLCIFFTVLALNHLSDRSRDRLNRRPLIPIDTTTIERIAPSAERGRATIPHATTALEIQSLSVHFDRSEGPVDAVTDVSLHIARGETLGLVGASGAGKTTTALAVLALVPPPGRVTAESVKVGGVELVGMQSGELRHVRGGRVGYVAQLPHSSLNPAYPIGHQIAEPLRWHLHRTRRQAATEAAELLDLVGIPPGRAHDFPHQLSGGEAQRVCIAMALAGQPDVLIADEPTSALDGVAQAGVLDLLGDLRVTLDLAVLLITHDMGVVAASADRVAVMHAGRIIETQDTVRVFTHPAERYTRLLIDSAEHLGATSVGSGPSITSAPATASSR